MSLKFPDIGTFGLIDGAWLPVTTWPLSDERPVNVLFDDEQSYHEFRPDGEVGRTWASDGGVVRVPLDRFTEIVEVGRGGRYRAEPVYRLGKVVNGVISVGLVSEDPQTAARLGFAGDGRIETFNKRIEPGEFTDVVEEVTVMYRRGEEGDVDG